MQDLAAADFDPARDLGAAVAGLFGEGPRSHVNHDEGNRSDDSDKNSFGTPPPGDPGGDVTMDNKDKDNPDSGSTDDDPSLSNKVNLDGSSANDNPGSRDFNTPHQLASSNTKASRFSLISVTKALLNEPTNEVMNTTMDKVSFGTLLMDDPGGFWSNGKGCAMYDYDYDVNRRG